jgi:hypothetical protein
VWIEKNPPQGMGIKKNTHAVRGRKNKKTKNVFDNCELVSIYKALIPAKHGHCKESPSKHGDLKESPLQHGD